jgi:predicted glutamine amidotransferase
MRCMCRLFGLHAGRTPVAATFWLLDAPGSLVTQSRRNPDGYGLATFDAAGTPHVEKAPLAAHVADVFAREARERSSTIFSAHVRYASVGELTYENTHPFVLDGRVFGHNGVVGDLDRVEAELGDLGAQLAGTTDSERLFALITARIRDAGGDEREGIVRAVRWLADEVELYSLNFVMVTSTDLWALRYPEGNELWVLERPAERRGPLVERGRLGEIAVRSGDAARQPVVVVASERVDDDEGWSCVQPGELLHVDADLHLTRELVLDRPPARLMELTGRAAESQAQAEEPDQERNAVRPG